MPKRRVIEIDDLRVESVPCIIVGASKPPVPIPLLTECGVTCIAINSTDAWLNKVVGDRIRSDKHFVIKDFITGVLGALAACRSGEEDEEAMGRPIAKETARRLAGDDKVSLMSLALEQDSDAEDLAAMPMHEDKDVSARNRKQVQGMSSGRFVKVAFRGLEFSVKAREKGRGVVVPLEGGSLETVLRHLREQVHGSDEQVIPSIACEDGDGARKRRRVVLESRDDIDGGRIRWLFSQCCYQVWFKDVDGKMHQTTRGSPCCSGRSYGSAA